MKRSAVWMGSVAATIARELHSGSLVREPTGLCQMLGWVNYTCLPSKALDRSKMWGNDPMPVRTIGVMAGFSCLGRRARLRIDLKGTG